MSSPQQPQQVPTIQISLSQTGALEISSNVQNPLVMAGMLAAAQHTLLSNGQGQQQQEKPAEAASRIIRPSLVTPKLV